MPHTHSRTVRTWFARKPELDDTLDADAISGPPRAPSGRAPVSIEPRGVAVAPRPAAAAADSGSGKPRPLIALPTMETPETRGVCEV